MGVRLKRRELIWLTIIVCLSISFFVYYTFFNNSHVDKDLREVAYEINKKGPIMIDSSTRFDNAKALPNNIFQFDYTILNVDKFNRDTLQAQAFIKSKTLKSMKGNSQNNLFRDKSTTLLFVYHNKAGKYLFRILFNPNEYK